MRTICHNQFGLGGTRESDARDELAADHANCAAHINVERDLCVLSGTGNGGNERS